MWISYEILQKQDDPAHLVIVKAWESVEAHQATAGSIPPDMLAKARELLAEPPSAGYYHLVEAKQA